MNPQLTLNQAALNLEQNNFHGAIDKANQVLKIQSDSAHALYILAIANAHINNKKTALDTFNKLIKLMPNNSDIRYNHAMILNKFGHNESAINEFKATINLNPNHQFAHINLGNTFNNNGDYPKALKSYLTALQLNPQNSGLLENLSQTYFKNKQFNNCLKYISKLKVFNPLNLHLSNLEIQSYIQLGNYRQADLHAIQTIDTHPNSTLGYYYHGLCSQKLTRYPIAIIAYKKALNIDINHIDSLKNLAICLNYSAQYKESKLIINKIYDLNPLKLDTLVFDYTLREMNNELKFDDEIFNTTVYENPQHPELFILHCKMLIASNRQEQAIKSLINPSMTLPDPLIIESQFLLASAYDKSKEYDLAWKAYTSANKLINTDTDDEFNQKLSQLIPQLNSILDTYRSQPTSKKPSQVIFIIGFPRSGTTLIDSILSTHNDSIVLEETPLIADLAEQVLGNHPFEHYIKILSKLDVSDIEDMKQKYFDLISHYHQWQTNQIVIDKSPLNLVHTLLIHKIFPESPIVFALRHPLDVCISCFMQNFRANPELTAAFSSPKSISKTYSNLMTAWNLIEKQVNLNKITVRYEDLINNTEQKTKELVEFVGLKWSDKYLSFHTSIKDRGMIHNPSYNQVNQEIYNTKIFRHMNYQKYMDQFQPDISNWIKAFNY